MRSRRAVAGFVLFALWLAFLAAFNSGNVYCFDKETGRSGKRA
jgi:hypothetical protein